MKNLDFRVALALTLGATLLLLAIWAQYFGPCSLWAGCGVRDVPARCMQEIFQKGE